MRAILAALSLCLFAAAARAESGLASIYSYGPHTASGERFDPRTLTAAHRTLPFGTLVTVCRMHGNCTVVTINDRGPFVRGRIIDLTPTAAHALGFSGLARVTVNVIQLGARHARHRGRHRHIAIRH